jgi:hypothetical protein
MAYRARETIGTRHNYDGAVKIFACVIVHCIVYRSCEAFVTPLPFLGVSSL